MEDPADQRPLTFQGNPKPRSMELALQSFSNQPRPCEGDPRLARAPPKERPPHSRIGNPPAPLTAITSRKRWPRDCRSPGDAPIAISAPPARTTLGRRQRPAPAPTLTPLEQDFPPMRPFGEHAPPSPAGIAAPAAPGGSCSHHSGAPRLVLDELSGHPPPVRRRPRTSGADAVSPPNGGGLAEAHGAPAALRERHPRAEPLLPPRLEFSDHHADGTTTSAVAIGLT